jgi:hypothetical protein
MAASDLPEDLIRRAWARALRHVNEGDASPTPTHAHDDPRTVLCPGGILVHIAIDARQDGRFARVSIGRQSPHAAPLSHEEAVPLVAQIYVLGRFEPYPVECVMGADQVTLHYVLDLGGYKSARAQDHIASAAQTVGASAQDGEIAAIQLTCPLWALARTWDLEKVRRRDARTIAYLSDRFLVPQAWIEFQVDHFLAELTEGVIDEAGMPRKAGH